MPKKPPQARSKIHVSNLQPNIVYVVQSPFGEAEVSLMAEDAGDDSIALLIHRGFLQNGNSPRKGKGEEFTGPADLFTFWEMVKAG